MNFLGRAHYGCTLFHDLSYEILSVNFKAFFFFYIVFYLSYYQYQCNVYLYDWDPIDKDCSLHLKALP